MCVKRVSSVYQECVNCLKCGLIVSGVSSVYQVPVKWVSSVSSVCQVCVKWVTNVCQVRVKCVKGLSSVSSL